MIVLDTDRGQQSGTIGTGVYSDTVVALFYINCYRMPVNDHKFMLYVTGQKLLSDPSQVPGALFGERQAGSYAGMHEQEIAEASAVGEAFEEFDVFERDVSG
ncbi:hypothetical protein HY17_19125 [Hyphomonas sp. CY54-11-8]|nr:hypothetical protein HY17_19125 [Hyphomonas sp. CY54-11-8]